MKVTSLAERPLYAQCSVRGVGRGRVVEVWPDATVDVPGPPRHTIIVTPITLCHEVAGHILVTDDPECADGKEVFFVPSGSPLFLARLDPTTGEPIEGVYVWRPDVLPPT